MLRTRRNLAIDTANLERWLRLALLLGWIASLLAPAVSDAEPRPGADLQPRTRIQRPRIAIVIDDVGAKPGAEVGFTQLGVPITFSLLPQYRETAALAFRLQLLGFETMLHLPAQPLREREVDGPGFLTLRQGRAAFMRLLEHHLRAQPLARGVNLHMGSRLSQDSAAMARILERLKRSKLFFLDSRTIHTSVAYYEALQRGLVAQVRDHFLDHTHTSASVLEMLADARRTAETQGFAVVIGHPLPCTLRALRQFIAEHGSHVELVPLSKLMHRGLPGPRGGEDFTRRPRRRASPQTPTFGPSDRRQHSAAHH
ncbi:MAG: divergent polysaccharide deacetylase family protein [Myxococcales bacterium]|nr:divergent polysaccharide deacetylase family protein [Myxococcales bacterium]